MGEAVGDVDGSIVGVGSAVGVGSSAIVGSLAGSVDTGGSAVGFGSAVAVGSPDVGGCFVGVDSSVDDGSVVGDADAGDNEDDGDREGSGETVPSADCDGVGVAVPLGGASLEQAARVSVNIIIRTTASTIDLLFMLIYSFYTFVNIKNIWKGKPNALIMCVPSSSRPIPVKNL
ncbi:MAG: hypothetical protein FWE70_07015 [Oscillospiraceae bacterium]|nr:hypothetical protein [Oscillospiraceae bacterium]